jgi:CBS domain containing-hemolysin-like protein
MFLFVALFSFIALLFYSAMRSALSSAMRLRLELESRHNTLAGKAANLFIRESTRVSLSIKTGIGVFIVSWTLSLCILWEHRYGSFAGHHMLLLVFCLISATSLMILMDTITGNLTRLHPYLILKFLAPLFLFSYGLTWPVTSLLFNLRQRIFRRSANSVDLLKKKESRSDDFEELVNSMNEGNSDIALEPEVEILQNALEFQDVKAGSCMIPRSEVVAMEINSSLEDLIRKFTSTRLTRILIYRENIENIIGYVHSFEMFRKPVSIISIIRPVVVVPETIAVQDLLRLFNKKHSNMAVVVDEYGGTSGILTLEDVIEELFGEIDDEHDNELLLERKLNEKEYLFSSGLEIAMLNQKYGFHIPESKDYTTLGGLVVSLAQGMPRARQKLFSDHFRLEVVELNHNRVETVKLILK